MESAVEEWGRGVLYPKLPRLALAGALDGGENTFP